MRRLSEDQSPVPPAPGERLRFLSRSRARVILSASTLLLLVGSAPPRSWAQSPQTQDDDRHYGDGFTLRPGVSGVISDFAVYDGKLIAAGNFQRIGDEPISYIAQWDGESWSAIATGVDDDVNSLAVYEGDLYAGGTFEVAGGGEARRIAKWDGQSWQPLGNGISSFYYYDYDRVEALEVFEGDLIVAGYFYMAGDDSAAHIAAWDGESWRRLGDGLGDYDHSGATSMAVYRDELYVTGGFDHSGEVENEEIARWDGANWHALPDDPLGTYGDGLDMTVYHDRLIVGGWFWSDADSNQRNIAAWDGEQWHALGTGIESDVSALQVFGESLIAGGYFSHAGGAPISLIAKWEGDSWDSLGEGLGRGHDYWYEGVSALTEYAGLLWVSGDFVRAGRAAAYGLARWDGVDWVPIPPEGAGLYGASYALLSRDDGLIVGGEFSQAGDTLAENIARWDGERWHSLGDGLDHEVWCLAEYDGYMVAGGYFHRSGETSVHSVAMFDDGEWRPLGSGMAAGSFVYALLSRENDLIAAGTFSHAGDIDARCVARWDGATWHAIGDGSAFPMFSTARALAEFEGDLYVGGHFSEVGGQAINNIVRWDGVSWHMLGEGPLNGTNGTVYEMMVLHDELIVAGDFTRAGEAFVGGMAAWNGAGWTALTPGLSEGGIRTMTLYNGDVVVGGTFDRHGVILLGGVARLAGENWMPFGSGVDHAVYDLAVHQGTLFLAGDFYQVGGKRSHGLIGWCDVLPDDIMPPGLTLELEQDRHASNLPQIQVASSEPLRPTSVEFTVNGIPRRPTLVDPAENRWSVTHELFDSRVTVSAEIGARDLSGNYSSVECSFAATRVRHVWGGEVSSPDGRIWLTVPPGVLERDVYLLVMPEEEPPAETVLGYHIEPRGILEGGPALLEISYAQAVPAGVAADQLYIERVGSGPIPTVVDSVNQRAMATIYGMGDYRLKTGPPGASEPMTTSFLRLDECVPNPFNPRSPIYGGSAVISFETHSRQHVTLDIYDVMGRKVVRLLDEEIFPGVHEATWNGRSSHGERVASGVYFYRVHTRQGDAARKLVVSE